MPSHVPVFFSNTQLPESPRLLNGSDQHFFHIRSKLGGGISGIIWRCGKRYTASPIGNSSTLDNTRPRALLAPGWCFATPWGLPNSDFKKPSLAHSHFLAGEGSEKQGVLSTIKPTSGICP